MEYTTVSETKSELPSLMSGGVSEAPRLETTGPTGSVAVMGVSTVAEGFVTTYSLSGTSEVSLNVLMYSHPPPSQSRFL